MGIEVLPPSSVVHSRPQEFKDVFEVSEEPPEAVTRERSHHFLKGLPSLKQRALRLKKLMPSKTLCRDDTHDCHVECTDGLIHLNSVEINNPLFEKRPHNMNYYANYQYTSSVCRTYPVGLANSSLSNLRLLSRAKSEDFNSIVVLEPCLEKGHHPEKVFSIPYLSPVNKNCSGGMKHKQSEYPVMENGRVQQHLLGTEDINAPRVRKERFLASDSIDPLQIGQEASFHQFSNTDASCSGSSQRYSCDNDSFRQTNSNRSSSDSTLSKIRRHAESAVGSKTLAEMFALSDSERLKLNSNSHSLLRRNKIDHDNGHSKDGCFIVLPKHAPLLSVRSSMDRNSCLEGSSQGKNNPNISNSYNNGKCQFHSFQDKPRLCKEIGNGREVNLRNASCFQNLMADNFSSPDCSNEKVLFTTDEGLVQQRAESEASGFNLQFSRKQRVCVLASMNLKNQKERSLLVCSLNYCYH